MAQLGFRTVNEMIGRADMLEFDPLPRTGRPRASTSSRILYNAKPWEGSTLYCSKTQDHGIDKALDHELMKLAAPTLGAQRAGALRGGTFKTRNARWGRCCRAN